MMLFVKTKNFLSFKARLITTNEQTSRFSVGCVLCIDWNCFHEK